MRAAFLALALGTGAALGIAQLPAGAPPADALGDDPWARLPAILARIRPPAFPSRDLPVTDFGGRAGGDHDNTEAFRAAIEACHRAGGGRVVVPPGDFLTGPIHLRSRVALHVSKDATVRFVTDPARYLPPVLTRWEGVELMNYSPLVYALDAEDVAITGEGTLDGQADETHWWPWKKTTGETSHRPARDRLFRMAEDGVPVAERVFGDGQFLRPSFVETYRSRNVLIEGVTIRNAPMWVVHPVLSQNVTVRNLTIVSHGPNNDGCNPESSSDVLIEGTLFDTGDDCIALKSGRNADGRRLHTPVERVVVRNCRMKAGHGGVTIGSEISGGARDVYAERCVMSSPDLQRGLRIKTNAVRGGVVENVFVRDVEIGEVGSAIDVDMFYEEGAAGAFAPVVRNIRVDRMTVAKAAHALFLRAIPQSPIDGLLVRDSAFRGLTDDNRLEGEIRLTLDRVRFEPAAR
jgi:polygalacturonase